MTPRHELTQNTLDEYINYIKRRVETGNNPPSNVFMELCHFAKLYKRERDEANRPEGGGSGTSSSNSAITLNELDELRMHIAAERNHQALAQLEHLVMKIRR